MPEPDKRNRETRTSSRTKALILLGAGVLVLFVAVLWQTSFDLNFAPDTNQQLVFFASLSALIFLLFIALTFVLARNLLKLLAERRLGILGSKFRTKLVVTSLLLSLLPVVFMFWFSYQLMNRSIDKWFSQPVQEVRQDTAVMLGLIGSYAGQNATAEAQSIAAAPETRQAFETRNFNPVMAAFRQREATLQGGFAIAVVNGKAEASFNAPAGWADIQKLVPANVFVDQKPARFSLGKIQYFAATARVGDRGEILVGMPVPEKFSETVKDLEDSQQRYVELAANRRLVRRIYMGMLSLLTVLLLFATTWLALYTSKLVTRPVVALAEAMQQISLGRLDYRVKVPAADEIGDLVTSFNRMAEDLEASRRKLESSSRELTAANVELEQRRQHIETILESIPTGVASLDANRKISHVNAALLRMFHPVRGEERVAAELIGGDLRQLFTADVLDDLEPLLRRADRMGTTTSQTEWTLAGVKYNLAVTVATLQHQAQPLGYVLIFEDLSDVLKAQKQAAWREVARRVAHEIKNPLTPIALSAERIRRHLQRGSPPDVNSSQIIASCADTIGSAVEAVRTLVDEFSALARFPTAQPQPASINAIVQSTLAMFDGRLNGVRVQTFLAPDLPKVMADPEGIKRALANLVDNAAEATQQSVVREIQISTSLVTSRDAVEIVVADSGYGVTQELKERLFLPYFSTKKRGTGLGLAIVSKIIEEHRGSIRLEENRPVGARFVVELPLAPELVSPPAA